MNAEEWLSDKVRFIATLVYRQPKRELELEGEKPYYETEQVIWASHPEIAYQIACARATSKRFIGISKLSASKRKVNDYLPFTGRDESRVVPKSKLSAMSNVRWKNVSVSDLHIEDALKEPPVYVEIIGLDDIDWQALSHAYGIATDVPRNLQRLASADPELRSTAMFDLCSSIVHQGSTFTATVYAVPYLFQLAMALNFPDRNEVVNLLAAMASHCLCIREEGDSADLSGLKDVFPSLYAVTAECLSDEEIKTISELHAAILTHKGALEILTKDNNEQIARDSDYALKFLSDTLGT